MSAKRQNVVEVKLFVLNMDVLKQRRTAMPMEPITVSVNDACKVIGLGRNRVYDLINEGKLETVRIGRRRLVKVDSIKRLVGAA